MSFIAELRRRNVIRVGTAYMVTAWFVIQAVETIFPVYGLGDGAIRGVITLLAIGLLAYRGEEAEVELSRMPESVGLAFRD